MIKTLPAPKPKTYGRAILLFGTLMVTHFLFYIDEGYYDFRWMRDIGNWIMFLIYTIVLSSLQLLVFEVTSRIYRRRGSVVVSVIAAWAVTFLLLAGFVFGAKV